MLNWLRRKFAENVQVESVDYGGWERVPSATQPVWRHTGCGDLVVEPMLAAHLAEKHNRQAVAQLSLMSDGTVEAIAPRGFVMAVGHVLAFMKFMEIHLSPEMQRDFKTLNRQDGKVVPGPWVN